ncbi:hypothetical protein AVEN_115369-1 [Araneus ventricosus]|uniref:Uncharacterized protein n=1 Tax=Araneus ventricosus TaxID=182803 RepID=A0A4Y1ZZA0_ARAVE|nr:hypothetical protein AVEN_115369-1 [Araneus ventricosus]
MKIRSLRHLEDYLENEEENYLSSPRFTIERVEKSGLWQRAIRTLQYLPFLLKISCSLPNVPLLETLIKLFSRETHLNKSRRRNRKRRLRKSLLVLSTEWHKCLQNYEDMSFQTPSP